MKRIVKQVLVIGGNCIVALILGLNLAQLYRAHLSTQSALNQQILSANPDLLLDNIRNISPAMWLWLVSWISLAVSLFIIVGWLIPKLRYHLWFWRLSFIWLWVWTVYFVASIVVLIILVNSLF